MQEKQILIDYLSQKTVGFESIAVRIGVKVPKKISLWNL